MNVAPVPPTSSLPPVYSLPPDKHGALRITGLITIMVVSVAAVTAGAVVAATHINTKQSTTVRPTVTAWCALRIGESESQVVDAMGKGDGSLPRLSPSQRDAGRLLHLRAIEWDIGNLTLIAAFDQGGHVVGLNAYDGTPSSDTASTQTPCAPVRDVRSPGR